MASMQCKGPRRLKVRQGDRRSGHIDKSAFTINDRVDEGGRIDKGGCIYKSIVATKAVIRRRRVYR